MSIQISPRYLTDIYSQAGNKFAPFEAFTDAVLTQMHIEEGTGKRQRVMQYQTQKLPGFDVASCKIQSEGQRKKVLEKLPGGVSFFPTDIPQISGRYLPDI
jgi:hypothetical protein